MTTNLWPALPLAEWKDTYETLHMWTQIIGKIRLALTPLVNHWWNVTLYVTPRGLTTSTMNYKDRVIQIDFDFINQLLLIATNEGPTKEIPLRPSPVSEFYHEVMFALESLGMPITIWTTPVEVPNPLPFEQDQKHASYDPVYAERIWRILAQSNRVLTEFRSRFIGKASPVHFFWGAFDLARFVATEAYSHEVSSCGFWPGGGPINEPIFYAYAYPEPDGFKEYQIQPSEAFYNSAMGEFLLPYDVVRRSESPDAVLTTFLQTTYEAAATQAKWDRLALERHSLLTQ
jgi:hypothetical protein